MLAGIFEVGAPHLRQIIARFNSLLPAVQASSKGRETATNDFRQQVISIRKMLVRCLMRNVQSSRHLSEAEALDARILNNCQRLAYAAFL